MTPVSLVIPGRNCVGTIGPCLEAVVPLLEDPGSPLAEIIFVDDGSTDGTGAIVDAHPGVTRLEGPAAGPGAARNAGWRAASRPAVWFIDSDCVAEADALGLLLPHLDEPRVAAVSGSYGNMSPGSLLACLIHEEIVERHRRMGDRVNWLATFNVLYRREVLEALGGFDERYLKAQDAELAFRVMKAGHELGFEIRSRVGHFHETSWPGYLRTQARQGYWRVWLHLEHRGYEMKNSYSGFVDHVQPPLAMAILGSLALLPLPYARWTPLVLLVLLLFATLPMTWRLVRRTGELRYVAYAPMSAVRAFWRGFGMVGGMFSVLRGKG